MNNIDNLITDIINKDIEMPEEYRTNIENSIYHCTHNTKKYKRYNMINKIKKIIITSLIGVSSLTVYATTTTNFNFKNMGLLKINQNYEENAVEINKKIENEYFTLTLESMAGDNAYIIAEYKIKLKEKALEEFGEVPYDKTKNGYQLNLDNNILINSQKCTFSITHVDKIEENEYYYSQVINVMNVQDSKIDLEVCFNNLYIGYYGSDNKIEINKKFEIEVNANKTQENIISEQIIDENTKIIIEGMFNTKFETYIKAQEIKEDIIWGEYNGYHGVGMTYDSFVVADGNGDVIPYQTYSGVRGGKSIYINNGKGEEEVKDTSKLKDSDKIKIVENFAIIIGKEDALKSVKVVPIRTYIYNDRNGEEKKEYDKAKWYPIVEGNTQYSAKSGLGGIFTVNKITIDDENINFYYDQKGLIGNEFKILIRRKNCAMNYIHSSKMEKKELDGDENKITFSRYGGMGTGLNTDIAGLKNIEDISQYEFTLLFGSKNTQIGENIDLVIPEQDENTDTFSNIRTLNTKKVKLKFWLRYEDFPEYITIRYDENNRVLGVSANYITRGIDIKEERNLNKVIEKIEKYIEEKGGGSEIVK